MSDCLSPRQIADYLAGRVAAGEALRRLEDHLACCEQCGVALRRTAAPAARGLAGSLLSALDLSCPPVEALVRYVDGGAGAIDREIVASHLELCERCAADVTAMRGAARELDRMPGGPDAGRRRSWWERASVGRPARPLWQAAAGAAIAGLVVFITYWATTAGLRDELARNERTIARQEAMVRSLQERVVAAESAAAELPRMRAANRELDARLARLEARPRVAGAPGGSPREAPRAVSAELRDAGGQSIRLWSDGSLTGLPGLSAGTRRRIAAAVRRRTVAAGGNAARLASRPGALLGDPTKRQFAVERPVGTAILPAQPELRWSPLANAVSYTVHVVDDADDMEVERSDTLAATTWTPSRPLRRGRIYRWYVEAALPGGSMVLTPAPQAGAALFRVLSEQEALGFEEVRRRAGGSHLALGVEAARLALMDVAEREFEALHAANPASAVARKLLASIRKARAPYRPSPTTTNPAQ